MEVFFPLEMGHTPIHCSDMPCQYTSSTRIVYMKRLNQRMYGDSSYRCQSHLGTRWYFPRERKYIIVLTISFVIQKHFRVF